MSDHHEHLHSHRFPFGRFFAFATLNVSLALLTFWLLGRPGFEAESRNLTPMWLWVLAYGIPLSLFEYLYHRYLLHSAVLPFMALMHRTHSSHHGLTPVKAPVTPKEPERLVPVDNRYAIEEEFQEQDMMFPAFALPIFYGVFFLLLGLPAIFLFPGQPVLLSLIVAITVYYSAYELWHAVMHMPYDEYWRKWIEGPRFGRIARYVYGFHLMHHWRPATNLAVVGLWGFAVWDHLFRTHHRPAHTPLVDTKVNYLDAKIPQPRWPISMLDRWQVRSYQASRRIEQGFGRLFAKKQ